MRTRKGLVLGRAAAIAVALLMTSATAVFAQPSNDNFNNATVVPAIPYSQTIDTSDATTAPSDPDTCVGETGATVWYSFTPAADVHLGANTFGSDYDTVVSVWAGGARRLSLVACNDDVNGLQSALVFDATGGVTYFFMIGSFGGGPGGSLTLNLQEAPPPPEAQLSIDPTGTIRRDGTAVVGGTLTCSAPVSGFIEVFLRQTVNRPVVEGFGFTEVDCPGETTWDVAVFGNGSYVPGPASAAANAFVCDDFGQCVQPVASRIVVLQ